MPERIFHESVCRLNPKLPAQIREFPLTEEFLTTKANRRVHPMASARNIASYRFFECLTTKWRFFLCKAAIMTGAKRPYHYLGELLRGLGFVRLRVASKKSFPKQCRFLQEYYLALMAASGVEESSARMGMNKMYYIYYQSTEQLKEWENKQALLALQQQQKQEELRLQQLQLQQQQEEELRLQQHLQLQLQLQQKQEELRFQEQQFELYQLQLLYDQNQGSYAEEFVQEDQDPLLCLDFD